jgi:hypothetical protein
MERGALRPLLALLGARPDRACVEVFPDTLTFRFGFFVEVVARSEIESAARARWPLWCGVGWRLGVDRIGLISAARNVVELRLREPRRTVMLLPWRYKRIFVSLADADGFLAALAEQGAAASGGDRG